MVDGYDAAAKANNASIVLAGGFCALAGDLGAQLAIAALGTAGKATHTHTRSGPGTDTNSEASPVVSVDAWLEKYNGGLSAGVLATPTNASYPKQWATDPYVPRGNPSARFPHGCLSWFVCVSPRPPAPCGPHVEERAVRHVSRNQPLGGACRNL